MSYVLVLFFFGYYNSEGRPVLIQQEFTSKANCEQALAAIKASLPAHPRVVIAPNAGVCTPK